MRIVFEIEHSGEVGAGILPYTDEIMIDVHSGDPGGLKGEFAFHMQHALSEWFDGAKVCVKVEAPK